MNSYPVVLEISGWNCVIVGGGKVATRKADDLLRARAKVTVISPKLTPALAENLQIQIVEQIFEPALLIKLAPRLVIAATNSPEVNQTVAEVARELGALVNIVDRSAPSDFHNMATIQQGEITLGISTGIPTLTRYLHQKLELELDPVYQVWAAWLAEIRPLVNNSVLDAAARRIFWRDLLALLEQGATRAQFDLYCQERLTDV